MSDRRCVWQDYFEQYSEANMNSAPWFEKHDDPRTGRTILTWSDPSVASQHLYFTCPSVTSDDAWLVHLADEPGPANVWAVNRRDGRRSCLSQNDNGLRLAYCYPWGGKRGLAKSTPSVDPQRNRVFCVCDDIIYRHDLDVGKTTALNRLPDGAMCGFTQPSPDGRYLALPLVFGSDFARGSSQAEQLQYVTREVLNAQVRSTMFLVDVEHGEMTIWVEMPFWVSHVAFDPTGQPRAIFNCEGPWDMVQGTFPRTWCLESDGSFHPLYRQEPTEECGHENWSPDGRSILNHGSLGGRPYLARRTWDGQLLARLWTDDLPFMHHATPDPSGGWIVDAHDDMIHRVVSDGDGVRCTPIATHGNRDWTPQDRHPHPILNPNQQGLCFTSSTHDVLRVCEVRL